MINTIGTVRCEVSRMAKLLTGSSFLERYFDPAEQAYILSRGKMATDSMAGTFAAKEALAKALGTGYDGVDLKDIVIAHDDRGAPAYQLRGLAKERADSLGVVNTYLSISHDGGMALAFAVLEGE